MFEEGRGLTVNPFSQGPASVERRIDLQLGHTLEATIVSALYLLVFVFCAFVFLSWPSAIVASVGGAGLVGLAGLQRRLTHNFGLNRDQASWEHAILTIAAARSVDRSVEQVIAEVEAHLAGALERTPLPTLGERVSGAIAGFGLWMGWQSILIASAGYAGVAARPLLVPLAERIFASI
jgi:hypothetical protein